MRGYVQCDGWADWLLLGAVLSGFFASGAVVVLIESWQWG